MIRQPAVAGQFYPKEAEGLKELLATLVDKNKDKKDIIGALVPHAGYIYSGSVAGAVFSQIKFKDTFVIIGPNHTGMGFPFSIVTEGRWATPLGEVEIDAVLAEKILESSQSLQADATAHRREHSIEVQLPFLQYIEPGFKIVPIAISHGNVELYKEIGRAIAGAVEITGREAVVLASGDMTHYESQDWAEKKDKQAIEAIINLDEDELSRRFTQQNMSMCAYSPVVCLISAAKKLGARAAELVEYRTSGDATGDYSSVVGYAGIIMTKAESPPLVKLAKEAVEKYVRQGECIEPKELTPEMKEKSGVFVCIKKGSQLRGCIGTFEPDKENVAQETISSAINAAVSDPRFRPVAPEELDELNYTVDVLTKPESIKSIKQLDPKKYGLIVEAGFGRGLLLPDLPGIDTPEEQVAICQQKAGIPSTSPVNLYRFEVKRYQ
jgi:MEMO1 family protein